jgi:GT2 family glycosyltransferase
MKKLSKILQPRHWGRFLAVLLLLPFDVLVALSLWISELFYLPLSTFTTRALPATKPDTRKASIIILNWDGKHLLEEFLPSVVQAVRHDGRAHEIIVVDNGSRDESIGFLRTHYPGIKLVALPRNMRFTGGNNAGVQAARNDVVIFLNNDMQVEPDFIGPLLDGFQDESVFAVACQVFFQDKTRRREETGKTRVRWRMGFIEPSHDQITESDRAGKYVPIFWGGGGSCAFDRKKFLAVNGLDTLYDPFYLEDTDLSYQAWKRGWKSSLAVESVVVHKHRGTNKLKFGDNYVDNTIRKNQYLFIWKNITDFRWILSHGCLLPLIQARLMTQTNLRFEFKAFFRALIQLPEALYKRYRFRGEYALGDIEIFDQASRNCLESGENYVDFSQADFSEQLGEGWHELEWKGEEGFRWMARKGNLFLFPKGHERFLEVRGIIPEIRNFRRPYLKLEVYQDKRLIFRKRWYRPEEVCFKVPLRPDFRQAYCFSFKLNSSFCPARLGKGEDLRELGMIFSQVRLV